MASQHSKHPHWDKVWGRVQKWDWKWLREYIKTHDINQCTDEQGNTLLHCTVRAKNTHNISYLSHFCIDPNIKNAAGQTALQLAQSVGPVCLSTLQRYHLCIDFDKASTKPNGLDALFAAIYRGTATLGDTSGIGYHGNEDNEGRWTALHCAAMYDRPHLIRALRERFPNLDANYLNHDNCSALRLAAMYGHYNCIIALCECFPSIKAGDALPAACEHNRPACILILHQCFPQPTGNELAYNYVYYAGLMRAAFFNYPECIRALHLCFPDIDPNLQDDYGDTVLMHACQQGLPQLIIALATYFPSIDINMFNLHGKTALMQAIERNDDDECLMTLCECFPNIDPTLQDGFGQTALMFAARHSYPEPMISQLIKFFPDIDPNVQDDNQDTALMCLLNSPDCMVESIHDFLDTFPNVNIKIRNDLDETALELAIVEDNAPAVDLLLKRFPDSISLANSAGRTALMLAVKKNRVNLISILLKHTIQMQ